MTTFNLALNISDKPDFVEHVYSVPLEPHWDSRPERQVLSKSHLLLRPEGPIDFAERREPHLEI